MQNSRTLLKLFVFSAIPALVLLASGWAVLALMEARGAVETVRPDDRVAYGVGQAVFCDEAGAPGTCRIDSPNMIRSRVPVPKPDGVFRIAITGGSFAQGTPYGYQDSDRQLPGTMADWVQAILSARYPSTRFEVVNAGMGGMNSYSVAEVTPQLLRLEPDLLWIATGNNEGYVPVTPLNLLLHRWVLYRGLRRLIVGERKPSDRPIHMPQGKDTERIQRGFERNLKSVVTTSRDAGVALALTAMPIHFAYAYQDVQEHGTGTPYPADDPHLQSGRRFLEQQRYREAIDELAKSPNVAFAAYYLARCYEQLADFERARSFYQTYTQMLPQNRTRPSYNRFVRDLVARDSLILVDLESELASVFPNGIPPDEMFLDSCHMTWDGYYRMARAAVRSFEEAGLIPVHSGEPLPEPSRDDLIRAHGWEILFDLPANLMALTERKW